MRRLLITFFSNWICFLVIGELFPAWLQVSDWKAALIGGIILGIANGVIKPLLTIITLPLHILTLGLFAFIINATMLYLTAYFVRGINIPAFWPYAIYTTLIFSLLNWMLMLLLRGKN